MWQLPGWQLSRWLFSQNQRKYAKKADLKTNTGVLSHTGFDPDFEKTLNQFTHSTTTFLNF